MPLQATSGAASYDAFGGGSAAVPNYIEDVFSTWLYTGNGATQTITNGIDLAGKGGLTWIKRRSGATDHAWYDTARGATFDIASNLSTAQTTQATGLTSFSSTGFALGALAKLNTNAATYVSWTFRKQSKFFDVVTYSGNGDALTVSHQLGSVPGCIMIKRTNASADWVVYHRSLSTPYGPEFPNYYIKLNSEDMEVSDDFVWNTTAPTATTFDVLGGYGGAADVCEAGGTYVAYLFAHDSGGFGLTGTDNVISCGGYTGNGSATGPEINLGYEPQLVLIKAASGVVNGGWILADNIRGLNMRDDSFVELDDANAEYLSTNFNPTSTGFQLTNTSTFSNTLNAEYIYIAIRRGPMKVPETGTSVFAPIAYTATNVDNRLVNTGLVTDMTIARTRGTANSGSFYVADRLRGNASLSTATTGGENTDADTFMTPTVGYGNSFSAMNGFGAGNDFTRLINYGSLSQIAYAFKRAPGFFDEVCSPSSSAITHNLGVAPELVIFKSRSTLGFWYVCAATDGYGLFNKSDAWSGAAGGSGLGVDYANATSTTVKSTNFYSEGAIIVTYLFASCPGVSKVGSYTGNGATQTIACGFTGGARFVLIKRTDAVATWLVWDTARGMVSGTDPSLTTTLTTGEVNANNVYTATGGFELVSADAAINASGGSYIFLAIA
jgi:hypothetical protein